MIYQFVSEQIKYFLVDCRDLVLREFRAEVSKSLLLVHNALARVLGILSVVLMDENSPMG